MSEGVREMKPVCEGEECSTRCLDQTAWDTEGERRGESSGGGVATPPSLPERDMALTGEVIALGLSNTLLLSATETSWTGLLGCLPGSSD